MGDQKIIESGMIYFVDQAVFNVFSFEFEKGSAANALTQKANPLLQGAEGID